MKKMKETSRKIEEISVKIWENIAIEIPDKFWKKSLRNFDWIIPIKIFMEFKFVELLRKTLKTLDYFLIKFEIISSIEIKLASTKIVRKF